MRFKQDFNIRWHDTNANREVTPSAILTYMQETTNSHIRTMYPYLEYIRDVLHQAFILAKAYIRLYEPAYAYENITVETWTGTESRGCTFYRSFKVMRGNTVIADALTAWVLFDTVEKKLLHISKFENNFIDEPSIDINMPRMIVFPKNEPLQFVGKRRIVYSDIDYNMHMNNTHYPDMLVDFLPSPEEFRIKELMLSFLRGADYNDNISVFRVREGNAFYFKTFNFDGNDSLEAYMLTEEQQFKIK